MEIPLHLGKVCLLPRDTLDCCEPEAQLIKSPFFPPSSLFPSRLAMQSCWSRHSAAPKVIAPASTGIWDARTPPERSRARGRCTTCSAVLRCGHSSCVSVGSKPLRVSQQPSQDDCAGEKCDNKSREALPLESSVLKAPGLFQLLPQQHYD